jgi:hypothetical protein
MTDNPSLPAPGETPPEPPAPTQGWPAAPAGVPPTSPLRRYRGRLISGSAVALVVLGLSLFLSSHSPGPRGSISLPASLLGLPQYTGPGARGLDARLASVITTGANRRCVIQVVAAAYGDLPGSGPQLTVIGGGLGGTCTAKPTGQLSSSAWPKASPMRGRSRRDLAAASWCDFPGPPRRSARISNASGPTRRPAARSATSTGPRPPWPTPRRRPRGSGRPSSADDLGVASGQGALRAACDRRVQHRLRGPAVGPPAARHLGTVRQNSPCGGQHRDGGTA